MTTESSEVLQKARRLISKKKNWTRGTYRSKVLRRILPDYEQYCLVGAVAVAASNDPHYNLFGREVDTALEPIKKVLGVVTIDQITKWNDRHAHSDVLAVLDAAIDLAEQKD